MSDPEIDDLLGDAEDAVPALQNNVKEYEAARRWVVENGRVSASSIQREFKVGYNKAKSLVEDLEARGVVSAAGPTGSRTVLELPEALPTKRDVPEYHNRKPSAEVIHRLHEPVSISFLAAVLDKDRKSVTRKVKGLTPIATYNGSPLYDFREAIEHLVPPKANAKQTIKSVGDLPAALQKDVWDAMLKAQKWKEQAGQLWPTGDVLEVLGETFQRLKTTTQLWIDQLGETHSLPPEVRNDLVKLVDGLQRDLHQTLVEMPKQRTTPSQLAEIEGTDMDVDV